MITVWNKFQVESKLNYTTYHQKGCDVLVQYSNNKIYAIEQKIGSFLVIMDTKLNMIRKVKTCFPTFNPNAKISLIVSEAYVVVGNSSDGLKFFDSNGNSLQVCSVVFF